MIEPLFEKEIICQSDEAFNTYSKYKPTVDVAVYSDRPSKIQVCTPDGGVDMSLDEIKQLVQALQDAIAFVEAE